MLLVTVSMLLGLHAAPRILTPRTVRTRQISMQTGIELPRNVKEMIGQLRSSVQGALSSRESRISVEMPVGFEFGVEGERAKRKGSAKVLTNADIERSNRELARLFVGMFEGTGLAPLVLFPTVAEAAYAKKFWAAPGLEARVQALVPSGEPAATKVSATTAATSRGFGGGGGGFGGGAASKGKGKGGKAKVKEMPPLARVPEAAEVIVVVAPYEAQMSVLREFCESAGMEKLVILLNARLEDALDTTAPSRRFFAHGGDGGFVTAYTFLTQPLGVKASEATPKSSGDPLVLWRSYPSEWVFARKPAIGAPRRLLERAGTDSRPSVDDMKAALEAEPSGMLGGLLG